MFKWWKRWKALHSMRLSRDIYAELVEEWGTPPTISTPAFGEALA